MNLEPRVFCFSLLEIRRMSNESQTLNHDTGRRLPFFKQPAATGERETVISYECRQSTGYTAGSRILEIV